MGGLLSRFLVTKVQSKLCVQQQGTTSSQSSRAMIYFFLLSIDLLNYFLGYLGQTFLMK
jgi:hypothetical protein